MSNRDICVIIKQIKELLPEGTYTSLIMDLDNLASRAAYIAPECQGFFWGQLADLLWEYLEDPRSDDYTGQIAKLMKGDYQTESDS